MLDERVLGSFSFVLSVCYINEQVAVVVGTSTVVLLTVKDGKIKDNDAKLDLMAEISCINVNPFGVWNLNACVAGFNLLRRRGFKVAMPFRRCTSPLLLQETRTSLFLYLMQMKEPRPQTGLLWATGR